MLYSQPDIDTIVDEIVNQYNGQTINYLGEFPGESVVPVAYYVDKIRGTSPVPKGNWAEDPAELTLYFNHEAYRPDMTYPKGTILIWSGHLAILTRFDNPIVEVFEQNASPEGTACRLTTKDMNTENNRCNYVLMPILYTELPLEPKVVKPYVLPLGAMKLPITEKKYFLRSSVPGYPAYSRAASGDGALTKVSMGNYYIYRETAGMLNITKEPGRAGYWINPNDNT